MVVEKMVVGTLRRGIIIMKVLIVDDSTFARKTIHKLLKDIMIDIQFIFAGDGQEGFETYQTEKPDLIITDLLMPKMSGEELVTAIREHDVTIPIIVTTANIQQAAKENMEKLGISMFITKPITDDKIVAIEALLKKVISC